jgi:CDP-paratose synthetase
MKTLLITGINGFLGSHLAKSLKNEYNIIGLEYNIDNLFRLIDEKFKIYSSIDNFEIIFEENKIFAIIHAATIYRREGEPLENLIQTNIILPVRLFELANKYKCRMFLNTDTFFNHPDYNYSYLQDYTLSKKQVLEWLKLIEQSCKLINMKIFHMYGPDDAPTKFIPSIISRLNNRDPFIETTEGEQKRDFIFIDDVVSAFQCVINASQDSLLPYTEYQIGTGKSISLKEFILLAKKVSLSTSEINFGALPYRKSEIMLSEADISGLSKLNWKVKYTLKDGLLETIKKDIQE